MKLFDPEKSVASAASNLRENLSFTERQCPPAGTSNFIDRSSPRPRDMNLQRLDLRYSIGDRFNLFIPNSPEFSGDYVINGDGRVILPFSVKLNGVGLTNDQLTYQIERALIRSGMFSATDFRVSVRPVVYAAVNVTVGGAVFLPGRFSIGGVKDMSDRAIIKSGDAPQDRDVAAALRAAGGIRPDANLARIHLRRGAKSYLLDWRGAFTAERVDDLSLIDGDHIEVEEAPCFQSAVIRPSQITPPGIRIFQSNLTQPTNSNAASAIGQQSQNIPYGTRFLAGLVLSNCVGGSLATNARRYGVLISRNPKTRRTEVIQRSIEEIVRSPDRDQVNPYLMPDDAIACYDSAATDVKEFANWLENVIVPAQAAHVFRNW